MTFYGNVNTCEYYSIVTVNASALRDVVAPRVGARAELLKHRARVARVPRDPARAPRATSGRSRQVPMGPRRSRAVAMLSKQRRQQVCETTAVPLEVRGHYHLF